MTAVAAGLERLEILDVLWSADPATGERLPVDADAAAGRLRASGQEGAARIVERMPRRGQVVDPDAIDRAFLGVHYELARLSQFLHVPHCMATAIAPLIQRVRESGPGRVTVVDLGCGIGLDTRHLALRAGLGDDVDFVGLDFNSLLVTAATSLARREGARVHFMVGDALDPQGAIERPDRTVVVSSGVLHHMGRDRLPSFFERHATLGVAAFAHFDVDPGLWSRVGGWVLHQVRMREPISRHDGNMSMRRALPADMLLAAADAGTRGAYRIVCEDGAGLVPMPHRALRPIVGVAA